MLWPADLLERHERMETYQAEEHQHRERAQELAAQVSLYSPLERDVMAVPADPRWIDDVQA